ncbi:MAG TPA: DUF952 domain-containing protein [Polyangiaceae bacterium]|nr:DUF952 domain-containing protein [Polyangiaceae bacterium]
MRLYRILSVDEWSTARQDGVFHGSPHDVRDGFVHLSGAHQVAGTLAAHYEGKSGLVLLVLDGDLLSSLPGIVLRWETSRDGADFPHLYGALPVSAVLAATPLALDADGVHVLPALT